MVSYTKDISVFLIGDPPFESFHSMEIYEKALSCGLMGMPGIVTIRNKWPEARKPAKSRNMKALQGYWDRHLRYPSFLKAPPADIYHILDHSYAHLLSRLPPEKTIITCHDLMPLMVEGYEKSWGGRLSLASFRHSVSHLHKARHIIVDSGSTKNALIDVLGLTDKNITVVPLGVDEIFCPGNTVPDPAEAREVKYILQVGVTSEPYKNTMNILRAFSQLLKNRAGHIKLLKVGKEYTEEQHNYIENEGLSPHIQYLGFVERKELPDIYRHASVLLMPSLYEGFGIPILEAMACGVPVVASRRGSISEVAGEAVLYVDPADSKDIAEGVEKVLNDSALRQDLIAKGLLTAKAFTWKRTATETCMVYQKTANTA